MIERAREALTKVAVVLVDRSTRWAVWLLIVVVPLTGALLYYAATHLTINTNTEDMLDPDLSFRRVTRALDEAFPQLSDLIVIVVDAPGAGIAQAAADTLASRIRAHTESVESVYQPGGGEFFARNGLLYLSVDEVWALNEQLVEAQPFLGTMAHDPSLRGLFTMLGRALEQDLAPDQEQMLARIFERVSEAVERRTSGHPQRVSWQDAWLEQGQPGQGSSRSFILVRPRLDYTSFESAKGALQLIRQLRDEPEVRQDGALIRVTGSVAMENEEIVNVTEDSGKVTLLSLALVCVLLFLGLRSVRIMLALLLTLVIGLVWTGAAAAIMVSQLNLISVSFAVLFIGMGVDFSIQFSMRFREQLDKGAGSTRIALREAAAGIGAALALAAIIAAASFASFVPTRYLGLAELGIIAAASMVVAWVASLTVLPALLQILGVGARLQRAPIVLLAPLGNLIQRNRRVLLVAAAIITIGAAILIPRARFDFNPLNMRDPTTEAVATFKRLLADPTSSPYTLNVLAPSLDEAQVLAQRIGALDVVDKVVTLASYVPERQDEKLESIADMNLMLQSVFIDEQPLPPPSSEQRRAAIEQFGQALAQASARIADRPLGASLDRLQKALHAVPRDAQALAGLEADIVGDFPRLLDRLHKLLSAQRISLEDLPQDLKERYVTPDGRARAEAFPRYDLADNVELRRFVNAVQGITSDAAGAPIGLVEGSDVVIEACIQATLLALGVTIALTICILRELGASLLALVPVLLAMILTFASSVIFNLPLNLANVIALPLLIGLSNAFGIYLVMRKRGSPTVSDLFRTSTPPAILFSGFATMASFGSLAVARHPGMSYMGILIALAISYALLCTLLVLPAMMAEIDARRDRL